MREAMTTVKRDTTEGKYSTFPLLRHW